MCYIWYSRGELLTYDMKTKTTTSLYKDLPSDPNDPKRVNHIPPSGELKPGVNPEPPVDDPHHPSPHTPGHNPKRFPNLNPFLNPPQIPQRDIPDRKDKKSNQIIQ